MEAKFKINQKVNVYHKTHPFKGEVLAVLKWENPLSLLDKKGYDYHVKAEDDGETYKCPESALSLLTN